MFFLAPLKIFSHPAKWVLGFVGVLIAGLIVTALTGLCLRHFFSMSSDANTLIGIGMFCLTIWSGYDD